MTQSDQTNSGFVSVQVPFGLSKACPLRANTEAEAFSLTLRDCNGAELLSLVQDTESGELYIAAVGLKLADWHTLRFLADRNREKVR